MHDGTCCTRAGKGESEGGRRRETAPDSLSRARVMVAARGQNPPDHRAARTLDTVSRRRANSIRFSQGWILLVFFFFRMLEKPRR